MGRAFIHLMVTVAALSAFKKTAATCTAFGLSTVGCGASFLASPSDFQQRESKRSISCWHSHAGKGSPCLVFGQESFLGSARIQARRGRGMMDWRLKAMMAAEEGMAEETRKKQAFLVAPGIATQRQWNGKPVADTVLLHPHTDIAHRYWRTVLQEGDTVVDATCGNGNDTLEIAQQLSSTGGGHVVACDVQGEAFVKARALLERELAGLMDISVQGDGTWVLRSTQAGKAKGLQGDVEIEWVLRSHAVVLEEMDSQSIRMVVFNLGYLPGGDKSIVTETDSTLRATRGAMKAAKKFGCVSLTCYTGHEEGKKEEQAVLNYVRELPQEDWSCYVFEWANQRNKRNGVRAPTLVLLQRLSDKEAVIRA